MIPLKKFVHRLLGASYGSIFKEKMSHEASKLFIGTSYVAVGTLFGVLLSIIFNIVGARILGPENFGTIGLFIIVGGFLSVSMGLFVLPLIKYASEAQDESVQVRIISTSYVLIGVMTVASVIIYAALSAQLSQVFGISTTLFLFALVYAVALTFFALTLHSLRIFFKMRAYALFNAAQSVILLAVFLLLVSNGLRSWQSASYSLIASCVSISLILVIYLRKYLTLRYDQLWARTIAHYSLFYAPTAIAVQLMGVDRLFINAFTTTAEVGIYNAYFIPSITLSVTLWGIFNTAFFPYASRSRDRYALFLNINKTVPYLAAALVPAILLVQRIAFVLYGRQYPFSLEIALFFTVAATASFFYQSYSWLMASEGTRGAKVNALGSIIALIVLISGDVILIPRVGISGAAITLILAYGLATFYLVSKRRVLRGR